MELQYSKEIPDGAARSTMPKIEFKRAAFQPMEPVTAWKPGSPPTEALIEFSSSPTRVIKSVKGDSYRSITELKYRGHGTLESKNFILFLDKVTLEHPEADKIGDSQLLSYLAYNGEGGEIDEDYLGLTRSYGEKSDLPMPTAPKYEYHLLGHQPVAPAELTIK